MSPVEWFYAQENQRFGPVSAAELKALADAGKLRPEDLVWREGMDGWVPARRVKGLFEAESPPVPAGSGANAPAAEASAMPTEAPAVPAVAETAFPLPVRTPEPTPRGFEKSLTAFYRAREGTGAHLFDFLLDLFRRSFPAVLVEGTCQAFSLFGYYGLHGAMALWLVMVLMQGVERKESAALGWGLAGLIVLAVLQYTAGRFLQALDRLNKSSSARLCSTAFLDCLALLLLALGVGGVLAVVIYAVQQNQYLLVLGAVELFIAVELAALVAVAPETVQITVSPETRPGEEALGVWAFLLKLLVKLTPVLFGLGVLHGIGNLLYSMVLWITRKPESDFTVGTGFWYLASAAALPLAVYLVLLAGYLSIDLMRAVLELPRLLQTKRISSEDHPSEEN
jgi:hypothetical protein